MHNTKLNDGRWSATDTRFLTFEDCRSCFKTISSSGLDGLTVSCVGLSSRPGIQRVLKTRGN
jgi:hypothetical protein